MPPEDRKPPRPPLVYKDYGSPPLKKQTAPQEIPIVVESSEGKGRHDPTPPPRPGTISNEDLAVQIKDVKKEHGEFATETRQRFTGLESTSQLVLKAVLDRETITHASRTVIDQVQRTAQIEENKDAKAFKRKITLEVVQFWGKIALMVAGSGALGAYLRSKGCF